MNHASVEEAPLLRAIPTLRTIGVGRSKAYEILNSGELPAVKVGQSTFIRRPDWNRYVASRPAYINASVSMKHALEVE